MSNDTETPAKKPGLVWTDAPSGSAGHVGKQLVCQIRKLGVGGWSAHWNNGLKWDVSDILKISGITAQASRPFKRRDIAKSAVIRALASGAGLTQPKEVEVA